MAVKDIQQTNKQHGVPQNIMDVEFKVIGDLTMRQFFYLLINGIVAYASFMLVDNAAVKWLLVVSFALFGLALAFLPFEERGLDAWIINFFKVIYQDNQRVWRKDVILPSAFTYENLHVVRQEMITLAPTTSRRKLEEYLESYGASKPVDPLDIDIAKYVQRLKQAYSPPAPSSANTYNTAPYTPPAPGGNMGVPSQPQTYGGNQ